MSEIKDYLFDTWTKDPLHISSDPENVDGKLHKGRWRVLKIGATVAANVLSVPQDMVGLAAGAVAGLAAGVVGVAKAFFCDQDCKQAFSKTSTKGATAGAIGGTIVGSVLFFPLAIVSYGLSWLTARKGEISRSNFIINLALRALNKSDAPALPGNEIPVVPSFKALEKRIGPGIVYKVESLQDLEEKSDWWKNNINQPIVTGLVQISPKVERPFIAIRVVRVSVADTTRLDEDSIIIFCGMPPREAGSQEGPRWLQMGLRNDSPEFKAINLDPDQNVKSNSIEGFSRLMRLVNGEEITEQYKDGFIWRLWGPPTSVKSAQNV